MSAPLSVDDKKEIIARCLEHDKRIHETGFRRCLVFKSYFIKYNDKISLFPEYKTQEYILQKTVGHSSAPRVPKIYDYFMDAEIMAYLVMEHIDTMPNSLSYTEWVAQVANAIQWLHAVPVPSDVTFGPVGGGPARHPLFKGGIAPLSFTSKGALERYMNKALTYRPKRSPPLQAISFEADSCIFTQSDMDKSNFLIDTDGRICLIDFGRVGVFPQSFASFTLHSSAFGKDVASCLNWPHLPNVDLMAKAGIILQSLHKDELGLDNDGHPKTQQ